VTKGYIMEFDIECSESFSSAERKFVAKPRRRLLEEIPQGIRMLFMEKGIMRMDTDRMAK
jgi:hypothetical protein